MSVDVNSAESMTCSRGLISGHEFDRGLRLVVYNDTPCHHMVSGMRGVSCGWYARDHASEQSTSVIEDIWPSSERLNALQLFDRAIGLS